MELSKKTTILLTPDLHDKLSRLASNKGISLGEVIRQACEKQYGITSMSDRVDAVRRLAALALPVGDVATMKDESVPTPDALLP